MNDKDTVVVLTDAQRILRDTYADCGCGIPSPFDEVAEHAVTLAEAKGFKRGQALSAAPSTSVREEVSALVTRLRAYRPVDEWGEGVRHTICDEAADALEDLAALKPSTDKGGEE